MTPSLLSLPFVKKNKINTFSSCCTFQLKTILVFLLCFKSFHCLQNKPCPPASRIPSQKECSSVRHQHNSLQILSGRLCLWLVSETPAPAVLRVLTRPWLSGSMTIIWALWSQIMRQKSVVVWGKGCWVTMNSLLL